jgi:REP element-mobilizing transposase RayT
MSDKFRDKYRIPSNRLPNWDYSNNGYYFITICTKERKHYFGEIINNKMQLSNIGEIVQKYWLTIPNHFPFVELDESIIMPNHIHGIIVIRENKCRDGACPVSTEHENSIGNIVGSFKSIITKYANCHQIPFYWQPRFYDRIVRNEKEFFRIRQYIKDNLLNWDEDRNNF